MEGLPSESARFVHPAMQMLNQLVASQADHSLVRKLKIYTDPTLLVCDELGYLSLDQQTSNLFYQVISTRHAEGRSTVITTNTIFPSGGTSCSTQPLLPPLPTASSKTQRFFFSAAQRGATPKTARPRLSNS